MTRGKPISEKTKEKALAMLTVAPTVTEVANELKIPRRTVSDWKAKAEKNSDEFAIKRRENKEKFIDDAWRIIEKANSLIERQLDRDIANKDESVKNDIRAYSTVVGTIYDKQALACGESTENINGSVEVKKFEDF